MDKRMVVIYKDSHFFKCYKMSSDYYDVIPNNLLINGPVELGDIVEFNFNPKENEWEYIIVEKTTKKVNDLEDVCLVTKVEGNKLYYIKNGENEIREIETSTDDIHENDLVYVDGTKVEKDTTFAPYFNKFLSKINKEDIDYSKGFSMTRKVTRYLHKFVVALVDPDDFDKMTIVPDYKLSFNTKRGDLHYDIRLGGYKEYVFDTFNKTDLRGSYNRLFGEMETPPSDDKKIRLEFDEKVLEQFKKVYKIMEEENKKVSLEERQKVIGYTSGDVLRKIDLEEYEGEENNRGFYRVVNESDDEKLPYIYQDELPENAREMDMIVELNKEIDGKKYQFDVSENGYDNLQKDISDYTEVIEWLKGESHD